MSGYWKDLAKDALEAFIYWMAEYGVRFGKLAVVVMLALVAWFSIVMPTVHFAQRIIAGPAAIHAPANPFEGRN